MNLVAAIGLTIFAQIAPPAPAPAPAANVTVRNEIVVEPPPLDPEATAQMAGWSFQGIVVTVVAPTLVGWANSLLDIPDFYRQTPPDLTYGNDGVRAMVSVTRGVAFALVALMLLAWGIAKAMGQDPPPGRPIFAVVLVIGHLTWWQLGIDLNNRINNAFNAPDIASLARPQLRLPELTNDPAQAFGPAVLVIVYAIVLILLIAAMAFRLGLLDILLVVGPLAFLCKGLEQTDSFFDAYVKQSAGTLFGQVMVVIALKLAPVLGLVGGGLVGTFLGIVVLLLARRMPGWLSNRAQQSSGVGRIATSLVLRRALLRI
jgi:hypothetical protein